MNQDNNHHQDFILNDAIDAFANHLTNEIKSSKKRQEVHREYAEHLEDAVYEYMLKGMTPQEAFRKACDDIGNTQTTATMLASVHNRGKLPRWVKYLCFAIIGCAFMFSPLFIKSEIFIAWHIFILELCIILLFYFGIYHLWLLIRAFAIRHQAIQSLRKYAQRNGHKLDISRPYASLFRKTDEPEIIYETETQRYIMSLWATVRRKKTLHLTDFGFYSYSNNIGYFLVCGFFGNVGASLNLWDRLPKDSKWWYWNHHEIVEEKPHDVSLMPCIEYESHSHPSKENVYVLLLNPIPFKVDFVENGVLRSGGDDVKFGDVMMWSVSGFMSYMDGRIMYEKKKFKSTIFRS